MKLQTKALWIPTLILVVVFLSMGSLFSWLVMSNSDELQNDALTRIIQSETSMLRTGLKLITASQSPADAVLGLGDEDSTLALDVVKQLASMGLDAIHFSNLDGKPLFSSQGVFPAELSTVLQHASREAGSVEILLVGELLIGYAPVIDIDTPTGFLVLSIQLPASLVKYATLVIEAKSGVSDVNGYTSSSKALAITKQQLETGSAAFLKKILMAIGFTLFVGLALIAAVLGKTSRNIIHPIQELLIIFSKMANGDFTQKVAVTSADEIGELQAATNTTITNLHEMINDVDSASTQIALSATRMEAVSGETRIQIERQQGDTQMVATAMNQMTATVQEVSRFAVDAASSATTADKEANDGHSVVNETIESIGELAQEIDSAAELIQGLRSDSEHIGSVIDVIRDIAEQTNLLALNAAIEAARAGEQGRGFAVVADEVRTLASRTQQSTQEIQTMILTLQEGVNNSVKAMTESRECAQSSVDRAAQAGVSLDSITRAVTTINDMNMQIASAAEEQATVVEEVNMNVVSISKAADESAESAHLIATASKELNSLSEKLRGQVSKFKL